MEKTFIGKFFQKFPLLHAKVHFSLPELADVLLAISRKFILNFQLQSNFLIWVDFIVGFFLVKTKVYSVECQQTFAKTHSLNSPIFFLRRISPLQVYK